MLTMTGKGTVPSSAAKASIVGQDDVDEQLVLFERDRPAVQAVGPGRGDHLHPAALDFEVE
ncbi:hypothetical protein [Arthrobacter sp. TMS1-12-1]